MLSNAVSNCDLMSSGALISTNMSEQFGSDASGEFFISADIINAESGQFDESFQDLFKLSCELTKAVAE